MEIEELVMELKVHHYAHAEQDFQITMDLIVNKIQANHQIVLLLVLLLDQFWE